MNKEELRGEIARELNAHSSRCLDDTDDYNVVLDGITNALWAKVAEIQDREKKMRNGSVKSVALLAMVETMGFKQGEKDEPCPHVIKAAKQCLTRSSELWISDLSNMYGPPILDEIENCNNSLMMMVETMHIADHIREIVSKGQPPPEGGFKH